MKQRHYELALRSVLITFYFGRCIKSQKMGFKRGLTDETSYQNGIARFEVELEYANNVIWRKGSITINPQSLYRVFRSTKNSRKCVDFKVRAGQTKQDATCADC